MFCPKCGCKVEDDDLFCPECGTGISKIKQKPKTMIWFSVISGLIIIGIIVGIVLIGRSRLNATTMRILSYEGSIALSDASGRSLEAAPERRLNDGNILDTYKDSKARVLLDEDRCVTLTEKSRASFHQENKTLRLLLEKGSLFFNIERPLEDDENFDIQTSTMIIGIRGTSGYVCSDENGCSVLYLTSGKVEVFGLNKNGDKRRSVKAVAGQKVTVITDGENVELIVEEIEEFDLPYFAILEICEDEGLLSTVTEETGWDKDILNDLADDPYSGDSETVADSGYSTDPARLVGIWKYRDRDAGLDEDYYELREDGTGVYYYFNADGTLVNYHTLTWDYLDKENADCEYDGRVHITVDSDAYYYWSHGMICFGDFATRNPVWYVRLEDDSFVPRISDEIIGTYSPSDGALPSYTFNDDATGYTFDNNGVLSSFTFDRDGVGWLIHFYDGSGQNVNCLFNGEKLYIGTTVRPDSVYYMRISESDNSSSDAGENQVAETLYDASDILGTWVDTRYDYSYTINEDGSGTGPYGMTFTWTLDDGGFSFEGIDMIFSNGILQLGETYFNDTNMVSETYYITLHRK